MYYGMAWACYENGYTRTVKKLLEGKPGERGRNGRLRLTWISNDKSGLKNMGVKKWRTQASDRTEWASVITEARPNATDDGQNEYRFIQKDDATTHPARNSMTTLHNIFLETIN
jgi:hypothetical protein